MKKLLAITVFCIGMGASRANCVNQPQALGVVAASTSTFTGGVGLWNITAAQALVLTPSTTGQLFFCSNCGSAGGAGTVCVSTGSTSPNQLVLSTGTACK